MLFDPQIIDKKVFFKSLVWLLVVVGLMKAMGGAGFVQIPQKYWNKLTPTGMFVKMRMWGYFVTPSKLSGIECSELRKRQSEEVVSGKRPLRILWVGRLLAWKKVSMSLLRLSETGRHKVLLKYF